MVSRLLLEVGETLRRADAAISKSRDLRRMSKQIRESIHGTDATGLRHGRPGEDEAGGILSAASRAGAREGR